MGDHQDRARIGTEIILEPVERLEIEVVRRLIQQQEVGLHDQQARQMGAHDPAAAHSAGHAIEVRFAEGEAVQDLFRLGLELPAAQFVKGRQSIVILLIARCVLRSLPIFRVSAFIALDDALSFGHLR